MLLLDVISPAHRTCRLVMDLLRELADERAYGRYLAAHSCEASPDAWRRFQDQRIQSKYANPRCC
jgi:hypothetical protein